MSRMSKEQRNELRTKTSVIKEASGYAVYIIPDDHVKEYFNYGKSKSAISQTLGKELAKESWGITEEEAVERHVRAMSEETPHGWRVIIFEKGKN